MSFRFLLLFSFHLLLSHVSANPLLKPLNQPKLLQIHGKPVKVDSSVPITWKTFGDTSIEYGLVEENSDGSDYEAKVTEGDLSNHATISLQKSTISKSTNEKQSIKNSSYVDEFARYTMLPLAAAAYNDRPQICLNNTFSNVTFFKSVNITCDVYGKDDICAGFTAVSHPDKAIIVSFRGTNTFSQLSVEISQTALKKQMDSPIGGKVGYYFADVFQKLWFNNSMGQDLESLQKAYPNYDLWMTGHSLGGALASLAAAQIVADGKFDVSKIKLYTFGQPRTGDADYANALDAHLLAENTYRITHSRDPVVHLPPHKYYNFTHNKAEVWYSNDMTVNKTYSLCTEHQESRNCSAQISYVFFRNDHLYYFNKHVSNYGKADCVTVEKKKDSWWSWFG
uniref:Fungal lipase-like domain-containing protein n=1 Tax=Ditylenchus dipsaci TaxID=166011 RepID=A0A915EPU8_9BILA